MRACVCEWQPARSVFDGSVFCCYQYNMYYVALQCKVFYFIFLFGYTLLRHAVGGARKKHHSHGVYWCMKPCETHNNDLQSI